MPADATRNPQPAAAQCEKNLRPTARGVDEGTGPMGRKPTAYRPDGRLRPPAWRGLSTRAST